MYKFLFLTYFFPRCTKCQLGLAMRKVFVCPSIRLSVCLSDKCVQLCPDFYTIRKIIKPSFLRRRMVGEVTPFIWYFGSTRSRWSEIADFQPIFARSASAVTPSEKVQLTLIRSPLRAFQWA